MSAYVWVEITVHDATKMPNYFANVGATVKQYGGRPIIQGGKVDIMEGGIGEHKGKVLLEFPSVERAHQWYDSPEYQAIIGERLENSTANFLIIEGFTPA